ncbi:uncharacterized protein [Dipodomys merriami]|uniref:uncharacterized protein n=1 Tax=Dipodomys merriami TaxID=94247 RepID=UPI003855E63E
MVDQEEETSDSSQWDSDSDNQALSYLPPHKKRYIEDTSQNNPEVEGESQHEESSLDKKEGASNQDTQEPMEISNPNVEAMTAPAVVADTSAAGPRRRRIITPIAIPDKRHLIQQLVQYYEEVIQLLEDVRRILRVEKLFVKYIIERMRRRRALESPAGSEVAATPPFWRCLRTQPSGMMADEASPNSRKLNYEVNPVKEVMDPPTPTKSVVLETQPSKKSEEEESHHESLTQAKRKAPMDINSDIRYQLKTEIHILKKRYERIFQLLDEVEGSPEVKEEFVDYAIKEAIIFKCRPLIKNLENILDNINVCLKKDKAKQHM